MYVNLKSSPLRFARKPANHVRNDSNSNILWMNHFECMQDVKRHQMIKLATLITTLDCESEKAKLEQKSGPLELQSYSFGKPGRFSGVLIFANFWKNKDGFGVQGRQHTARRQSQGMWLASDVKNTERPVIQNPARSRENRDPNAFKHCGLGLR